MNQKFCPNNLTIEGSSDPLNGIVDVMGAKNAVSKLILGGALVSDKPFTLSNLPRISEVGLTADMIRSLGGTVELSGSKAFIDGSTINKTQIGNEYTGINRIPILSLGALASRMGHATVPLPGGDPIGARPVDFHIAIIEAFGATVVETDEGITATAPKSGMKPTTVSIPYQSVGATEQFIFTAATIDGVSVLSNAAMEPELKEIGVMLTNMGASVDFNEESKTVTVRGKTSFNETHHHIAADPLVAVSFLSAALTSFGSITTTNIQSLDIWAALEKFSAMGATVTSGDNWVKVDARDRTLNGVNIETGPAPAFRTDWQAFFTVAATRSQGTSYIHETVYQDRFVYVPTLQAMGANITVTNDCGNQCRFNTRNQHYAMVVGNGRLQAVNSELSDIRGAFACVLAAANAEGISNFTGAKHLVRGYHKFVPELESLGMRISLS